MAGATALGAVFDKVQPPTTFEETVERLGRAIKLGLLPPGTRLPAERELAEELGVTGVPLEKLFVGRYDGDTTRYVAHVYEATYDGPLRFADGEVVWGAWMTLEELGDRLRDPDWVFVPDTRALLDRLSREGVRDYRAVGVVACGGPAGTPSA